MLASLQNQGYELTMEPDSAEVIIVNTCAFPTEASEESINRILDLNDFKSSGNCEKIVATGRLTQRYQDSLAEQIPELDGLLGSNWFEQIPELVSALCTKVQNIHKHFLSKNPITNNTTPLYVSEGGRGMFKYLFVL